MKMVVYLCGGLKSGWQDKVKAAVPEAEYKDPREFKAIDPHDYTRHDIEAINECKVVFAYLERDNPGGMNLAFELGVAVGMCTSGHAKIIILVDEKSEDPQFKRYAEMMRASSDIVTDSLDDAVACLRKIVPLTYPLTA